MSDPAVEFQFDGAAITAVPGQSIGAALVAAGRRSWRRTRFAGEPRGIFCGIGVCFDCLVTVNDRPNRRACLVIATNGDQVTTQDGAGHADLAC